MAIREGRWDCPSCGSTAIYGRHVECPGCAKPRPAGIRFYLTDDAPAITDPERLREASAGADWVCEHCGASNRATQDACAGCGAARGSSPSQRVVDYDNANVPRPVGAPAPEAGHDDSAGSVNAAAAAGHNASAGAPTSAAGHSDSVGTAAAAAAGDSVRPLAQTGAPGSPGEKKSTARGCCGCGALLLLLALIGSGIASLAPDPVGGKDLVPVVVESKRWERTVVVEQRRLVDGEGWELPDSARVVRQARRFHHNDQEVIGYRTVTREEPRTERVRDGTVTRTREVEERVRTGTREYVCGQRDLGNGYFEDIQCEEPVYETRTRTEEYQEPRYREVTRYDTVTENVPITRPKAVYQTWYTWRVPRWSPVDTLRAAGDTSRPAWPDSSARADERWRERTERYVVTLREAGGGRRQLPMDLRQWLTLRPGERLAARYARAGRDSIASATFLPADSLAACRRWHRDRKEAPGDSLGCSPPPPASADR